MKNPLRPHAHLGSTASLYFAAMPASLGFPAPSAIGAMRQKRTGPVLIDTLSGVLFNAVAQVCWLLNKPAKRESGETYRLQR
jgi:hypothetical protein